MEKRTAYPDAGSFSAGILLQWYGGNRVAAGFTGACFFQPVLCIVLLFPHRVRFKWQFLQGVLLNLCSLALGCLVTWAQDGWNHVNWYGKPANRRPVVCAYR